MLLAGTTKKGPGTASPKLYETIVNISSKMRHCSHAVDICGNHRISCPVCAVERFIGKTQMGYVLSLRPF